MRNFRYRIARMFFLTKRFLRRHRIATAVSAFVVIVGIYFFFISAPFTFPNGKYISIPEGSSLSQAANKLREANIIRSPLLFKTLVLLLAGDRHVTAGEYFFPNRSNVITVAKRLGSGDFNVDPARIRIPEGATADDIAKLLAENIPDFNVVAFMRAAGGREGYLFPDTYFFMPGDSIASMLGAFDNNFNKNIAKIKKEIDSFGKPLSEVVVMASLLEREAPNTDDRRVIAGILWKRIKLGMPLQVDAVFPYIIGKNSFDLTKNDLQIDSPYNTYTHKGLPPGPIANPGLDAILAAVTPIQTNYLFYLSDQHGNIHYSATYEQHLAAKNRYIGN